MNELTEKLKTSALFANCTGTEIEALLTDTPHRTRRYDKDSYIAHRGDTCGDVTMLVEGTIFTTMTNPEGKVVVIDTIEAPRLLAPAFIYAERNQFPVNVIAGTACTVLRIDRNIFLENLHRSNTMMTNFIGIISDRCFRLSQRLNQFATKSLRERVVEYLKHQKKIDNVQWMAQVMGVARPSLSRVLSDLKKEGLIERTIDGVCVSSSFADSE